MEWHPSNKGIILIPGWFNAAETWIRSGKHETFPAESDCSTKFDNIIVLVKN